MDELHSPQSGATGKEVFQIITGLVQLLLQVLPALTGSQQGVGCQETACPNPLAPVGVVQQHLQDTGVRSLSVRGQQQSVYGCLVPRCRWVLQRADKSGPGQCRRGSKQVGWGR